MASIDAQTLHLSLLYPNKLLTTNKQKRGKLLVPLLVHSIVSNIQTIAGFRQADNNSKLGLLRYEKNKL
jgi:hypothetical protein